MLRRKILVRAASPSYPAGQVVSLGSFWQSQAFEIKGANVPKAYAYIPNTR